MKRFATGTSRLWFISTLSISEMSGAMVIICAVPALLSLLSTWFTVMWNLLKEVNEMNKNKKAEIVNSSYEANRKIRKDWGDIKPITRVIPNKKKNQHVKHKGKIEE